MAEEQRRDSVIEFPQARLTAGGRLRAAREAAGLSLADMAGETKIPTRMLTLIEAGDYAALPAKAYATGFSRTCARTLGLDEAEIVAEVRRELGHVDQADARLAPAFEPGDPARVPTARFAWLAAVAALAVLALGLLLWRSYYAPAVTLPPLPGAIAPEVSAAQVAVPTAAPAPAAPVVVVPIAPVANSPVAGVASGSMASTAPTPARRSEPRPRAAAATLVPAPTPDGATPAAGAVAAGDPASAPQASPTSTTQF